MRGRSEQALLLNYWKTRITHVQEIQKSPCTFISDGSASACSRLVTGEFHKQMPAGAGDPLSGQILDCIRVIQGRRVNVTSILYEEPENKQKKRFLLLSILGNVLENIK